MAAPAVRNFSPHPPTTTSSSSNFGVDLSSSSDACAAAAPPPLPTQQARVVVVPDEKDREEGEESLLTSTTPNKPIRSNKKRKAAYPTTTAAHNNNAVIVGVGKVSLLDAIDQELENNPTPAAPVLPSSVGVSDYGEHDVLSGRGGGTNVHIGNRIFRDLIHMYRACYLKAKKNEKPKISKYLIGKVRQVGGAFLKKNASNGLYYEIGDVEAREKCGQALRQKAPEMRKLIWEKEQSGRNKALFLQEGFAAEASQFRQPHNRMGLQLPSTNTNTKQHSHSHSAQQLPMYNPYGMMMNPPLGGGGMRGATNGTNPIMFPHHHQQQLMTSQLMASMTAQLNSNMADVPQFPMVPYPIGSAAAAAAAAAAMPGEASATASVPAVAEPDLECFAV
jgi:hypothetical protein